MATKVIMPKEGLTMEEGTISKWLKKDGEEVKKAEPLLEILTDKVSLEVESPASGILHIVVPEKETVPITTVIGVITEAGEEFQTPTVSSQKPAAPIKMETPTPKEQTKEKKQNTPEKTEIQTQDKKIISSPRARKVAKELGVDIHTVKGSGFNGRIQAKDVELYATGPSSKANLSLNKQDIDNSQFRIVPLQGIRKTIATRLTECARDIPHVSFFREVNAARLIDARASLLEEVEKKTGIRPTLTDFLVKMLACAIKTVETANSIVEDDQIKIFNKTHVNLAVAADGFLYTPVIRNVEDLTLTQISQQRAEIVQKARAGKLSAEELSGGTVTLSNLGKSGVEGFTPILNPPQTVILGIGGIKKKPVYEEEEIKVSPMMTLSLSCDHRVLDGAEATKVLGAMARLIENPYLILA